MVDKNTSHLKVNYYIQYGEKRNNITFKCPLCQMPLEKGGHDNRLKNDLIKHINKHHYELSFQWLEENHAYSEVLENVITNIWHLEAQVNIINLIGKMLVEKLLLNEHFYNAQLDILNYRIKKLREISMQLTS